MANKIRSGDRVIVISGSKKIKGQEGSVIQVLPKQQRVIVDGVRMVKKHQKKSQEHPDGAIIEKPAPIHISKVALVDPKTKTATKVKFVVEDGKKVRISKKSGSKI